MNETKKTYVCPEMDIIRLDNDISLALESTWGDPENWANLEHNNESHLV